MSESGDDGDEEDVMLVLDIEGLVDRQPAKRRMSLESHLEQMYAAPASNV